VKPTTSRQYQLCPFHTVWQTAGCSLLGHPSASSQSDLPSPRSAAAAIRCTPAVPIALCTFTEDQPFCSALRSNPSGLSQLMCYVGPGAIRIPYCYRRSAHSPIFPNPILHKQMFSVPPGTNLRQSRCLSSYITSSFSLT
jgi:hypothetical protein